MDNQSRLEEEIKESREGNRSTKAQGFKKNKKQTHATHKKDEELN
jgi:hypothetical protein